MIMEFLVGRVTRALISIVSNIKYLAFDTPIIKRDSSSNVLNNKIFSMSEYHCSKFGIVVFTYCKIIIIILLYSLSSHDVIFTNCAIFIVLYWDEF